MEFVTKKDFKYAALYNPEKRNIAPIPASRG